jgi:hypothetical protein
MNIDKGFGVIVLRGLRAMLQKSLRDVIAVVVTDYKNKIVPK